MNLLKLSTRFAAAAAVTTAISMSASAQTVNGDFETGDLTGWSSFDPTKFVVTGDAASGSFAGILTNNTPASAAIAKQANTSIGTFAPGQEVIVSFDAKGDAAAGGVHFVEIFSELSGGGTSATQILGGAPLFPTSVYQSYSFNAILGPDVSGGVTLQFAAVTGGDPGSFSTLTFDNVQISAVPEPASIALIGLGGIAMLSRRRRTQA